MRAVAPTKGVRGCVPWLACPVVFIRAARYCTVLYSSEILAAGSLASRRAYSLYGPCMARVSPVLYCTVLGGADRDGRRP